MRGLFAWPFLRGFEEDIRLDPSLGTSNIFASYKCIIWARTFQLHNYLDGCQSGFDLTDLLPTFLLGVREMGQ